MQIKVRSGYTISCFHGHHGILIHEKITSHFNTSQHKTFIWLSSQIMQKIQNINLEVKVSTIILEFFFIIEILKMFI